MPFKIPNSVDECLYFTNRIIGDGKILAWVYRKKCPQCGKARMGKPIVKGKAKSRAREYQCPACKYTEDKETHEASVKIEAHYTCPKCYKEGESTGEYKRKNVQGTPSYVIICQHCKEKILLTKKLKGIGEENHD